MTSHIFQYHLTTSTTGFLLLNHFMHVQAALVIRGFAIRGFDYLRFHFYTQNLLSSGFPLIICGFKHNLPQKQAFIGERSLPLLSAVLVFEGLSKNITPANNEGRLYYVVYSEVFQ